MTGEFVAGKIYRYFVRDDVAEVVETRLGLKAQDSGYHASRS